MVTQKLAVLVIIISIIFEVQRIYCAVTRHISSAQQIILTSVRATTEVGSGIVRRRLRRTFLINVVSLSLSIQLKLVSS